MIGESLSEPHTSNMNGTSMVFTKILGLIVQASCNHKSMSLKIRLDNLQVLPDVCSSHEQLPE